MAEDTEEKTKNKELQPVPTGFVVSMLKPDFSAGIRGDKVAVLDTDPRHPGNHTVMVAGPLPVEVAMTPAITSAIRDQRIREVSKERATELHNSHREAAQGRRREALNAQATAMGISPDVLAMALAMQGNAQLAGLSSPLSQPTPPADSQPTVPALQGAKPNDGLSNEILRPVNPDKMSVEGLQREAAVRQVDISGAKTKAEMAKAINDALPGGPPEDEPSGSMETGDKTE